MYSLYMQLILAIFIILDFTIAKNLTLHNRYDPQNRELLDVKFSGNTMIITGNSNGRLISNNNLGIRRAGNQSIHWSPSDEISSGTYLYSIESQSNIINGKVLYLK